MNSKTPLTDRRRLLRGLLGAIAGIFAGAAQAEESKPQPPAGLKKRSKESVGYRDFPYENRTCAKCMLYVGDGVCVILEGKVSMDGWCNQWTPPTIGQFPRQLRDAAARVIDYSKTTGV